MFKILTCWYFELIDRTLLSLLVLRTFSCYFDRVSTGILIVPVGILIAPVGIMNASVGIMNVSVGIMNIGILNSSLHGVRSMGPGVSH